MPGPNYDYSPLTKKITPGELFAFGKLSIGLKIGIGLAVIALILPVIALIASPSMRQGGLYMIGIFLIVIAVIILSMLIHRIKYIKLQRFADHNHMQITRGIDLVHRRGAPFQMQLPTNDSIALTTPDESVIEIGNFIAADKNGMPSTYGSFGFIRFVLPREFPHIILDAHASDVVTRSSAAPLSSYLPEVVELEGDFPSTFHVYGPSNYGSDIRYVLPPDFMAHLVDNVGAFDIEIIDNEFYLYAVDFFAMTDPIAARDTFDFAYEFQQTLKKYLVPYSDWRIGDQSDITVAQEGRQLSKSTHRSVLTLIILAFSIAAYYVIHTILR